MKGSPQDTGKPVVNFEPFDFLGDPNVLVRNERISIIEKLYGDARKRSVLAPRATDLGVIPIPITR